MRRFTGAMVALALIVTGCAVAATPSSVPSTRTPAASASPASTSAASSTAPSSTPPSPAPSATPVQPVACAPSSLASRITRWEGAAGSWIAHLEVRITGEVACLLPAAVRPQLIDASGNVLIELGASASPASDRLLAAGGTATTEVRVGNYCGATPVTPLTIALLLPGGSRLAAAPLAAADDTVPACMGVPGSPGSIEIQPWGP